MHDAVTHRSQPIVGGGAGQEIEQECQRLIVTQGFGPTLFAQRGFAAVAREEMGCAADSLDLPMQAHVQGLVGEEGELEARRARIQDEQRVSHGLGSK